MGLFIFIKKKKFMNDNKVASPVRTKKPFKCSFQNPNIILLTQRNDILERRY